MGFDGCEPSGDALIAHRPRCLAVGTCLKSPCFDPETQVINPDTARERTVEHIEHRPSFSLRLISLLRCSVNPNELTILLAPPSVAFGNNYRGQDCGFEQFRVSQVHDSRYPEVLRQPVAHGASGLDCQES